MSYLNGLFFKPNIEKMGGERDVAGLIKALGCNRTGVPQAAHAALVKIGPPAVELLIAALKDSDSDVRKQAKYVLGDLGDARALEPLIALLKENSDEYVLAGIVRALGNFGDARAIMPLIALRMPQGTGRQYGYVYEGDYLTNCIDTALVKIGISAVEPLISFLKDENSHSSERQAAAKALAKIGDQRAVEPLILVINDTDENVRYVAAEALGKIGNPRAVEPLIAALNDSDKNVRYIAEIALKNFDDARVMQAIEQKKQAASGQAARMDAYNRGGLGEPYCSQSCFDAAARYAMTDIISGKCSLCGKSVGIGSGPRDHTVIPYEGRVWIVCQNCAPGMRNKVQSYTKCCKCQKPL